LTRTSPSPPRALRAAHRWLRLRDALAVAEVDGADEVLTCDQQWTKVSERVIAVGEDGSSDRS
jgi:hypothetical protein